VNDEQRARLDELRRRNAARREYIDSGGLVKSRLSLDKDEETVTQYIYRRLREDYQKALDKEWNKLLNIKED